MASDLLDTAKVDPIIALGDIMAETEKSPEGPQSSFKRLAAISTWNSVLLHVNDTLLSGFARHHIGRLAKSVASGLRVEVQTAWGSYIPSTVILRLQIRNGDDIGDFAVITLPMGQTKLPLNVDYFNAADEPLMKDMFSDPKTDHFGAAHSRFRDQDLQYFENIDRTTEISSHIKYTTATIARVSAVVEAHEFTIMYPSNFWNRIQRLPASLQKIAKNIKSLFDSMNPEEQVTLHIALPASPKWEQDWHVLFTDERKINPGILDIPSLCNGLIEDLDYSKILAGREEYGIFGTHSPTAYLMAVSMKSVRNFLPNVGTKVKVYLRDIAQSGYTLPKPLFTNLQVVHLASRLRSDILHAEYKASNKVDREFRGSFRERNHLISELFFQQATVDLAPYLHMPAKDDLQHEEARKAAEYLKSIGEEDDMAHYIRVYNWVRSALCVAPKTRYHEPYLGYRLDLPPGVSADVALFYVEVPRQRDWPHTLNNPPMTVDIPNMSPPTDLQQFLVNAFANQDDIIRAEIRYSLDTALYEEPSASSLKNNLTPNPVADDWWKSMVQSSGLPKSDQTNQSRMLDGPRNGLDN
ncbi:hypothetical protein TrVFT333_009680 [Trichoderma virens FT-333]|nr:hypothetical protein TrVFT333_009680 [Trichoderma virens FT-333]